MALSTAPLLTGLGVGASQTSFWVEVQPGRLGGGRRRDPGVNASGGTPAAIAGGTVPARASATPTAVGDLPASPTAATPAPGPTASSQVTIPSVPQTPDPTGTVLSGRGARGPGH